MLCYVMLCFMFALYYRNNGKIKVLAMNVEIILFHKNNFCTTTHFSSVVHSLITFLEMLLALNPLTTVSRLRLAWPG